MRELMIEAEYAPYAPDWFLETASRWFTVQKTPCLQTAEAVIGEPTLEALQNAPQLRWLQMTWAGADRYLHGGFPRGVLLTTASGAFGETIAEHAIGMLLALCRRLPAYARQGNWNDLGSERRVAGGTALIFGAGDLGGCIARRLQAFGVKTFGVCRRTSPDRPGFDRLVRLDEAGRGRDPAARGGLRPGRDAAVAGDGRVAQRGAPCSASAGRRRCERRARQLS